MESKCLTTERLKSLKAKILGKKMSCLSFNRRTKKEKKKQTNKQTQKQMKK